MSSRIARKRRSAPRRVEPLTGSTKAETKLKGSTKTLSFAKKSKAESNALADEEKIQEHCSIGVPSIAVKDLSKCFPNSSFVGGAPVLWNEALLQKDGSDWDDYYDLHCDECGAMRVFLLQMSAPLECELRTVYVWMCLKAKCASTSKGWKVLVQMGPSLAEAKLFFDRRAKRAAIGDAHFDDGEDFEQKYEEHCEATKASQSSALSDGRAVPAPMRNATEALDSTVDGKTGFGTLHLSKSWKSWSTAQKRETAKKLRIPSKDTTVVSVPSVHALAEETKTADSQMDALSSELFSLLAKAEEMKATAASKSQRSHLQAKKKKKKKRRKRRKATTDCHSAKAKLGTAVEDSDELLVDSLARDSLIDDKSESSGLKKFSMFAPFYLEWFKECFYESWKPSTIEDVAASDSLRRHLTEGELLEESFSQQPMDALIDYLERVSVEPSQVVRYDFCGEPLFPTNEDVLAESLTAPCQCCTLDRLFEFQIMNSVLNFVKPSPKQLDLHSWLTVAVFVCRDSCMESALEVTFVVNE